MVTLLTCLICPLFRADYTSKCSKGVFDHCPKVNAENKRYLNYFTSLLFHLLMFLLSKNQCLTTSFDYSYVGLVVAVLNCKY